MLIAGDPQRRAGRCKQSVLLLTAISLSSRSSLRYRVGTPNMPFVTSRAVGQRALLRQRNRNTDPDRKAVSPALAAGRSMVTLQTRIETLCSSTENVDRTDSNDAHGTVDRLPTALPSDAERVIDALRHARGLAGYFGATRGVFLQSQPALQFGSAKRKPPEGRF